MSVPAASLAVSKAVSRAHFERVRWTSAILLITAFMVAFFHRIAPAVIVTELMQGFHATAASLGTLAAVYYYIYTLMQIPSGILADTLGPRRNVAAFSIIAGIGSIIFALATNLWVAGLGRFLVGLGVSTAFIGLMKHNAMWFSERRYAAVSGVVMFVGNLGSVLSAGPLSALLTTVSWRTVFVGLGIFSFVLAALIWWLVKDSPEDAGLPSPRELAGVQPVTQYSQHWFSSLREAMANRALWPNALFFFGVFGNFLAFTGLWAVPLLRTRLQVSNTEASSYVSIMLFSLAVGSLVAGWLSDRIGRRKPGLIVAGVMSAVCWLAILALPSQDSFFTHAIFALFGFSAAAVTPGYASTKEVARPHASGMALALVNTALFLGAALMQSAFGWAMDFTWDGAMAGGVRLYAWSDYRSGLWLSLGVSLLGLIGALCIRETYNRNVTSDTPARQAKTTVA